MNLLTKPKRFRHGKQAGSWKVAQLCPTLCDSMDYAVHGILQARILEWVAVPFSRGSSKPRDWLPKGKWPWRGGGIN